MYQWDRYRESNSIEVEVDIQTEKAMCFVGG